MPKKLVDQLDPNICKRAKKESALSSTSGNAPTNEARTGQYLMLIHSKSV